MRPSSRLVATTFLIYILVPDVLLAFSTCSSSIRPGFVPVSCRQGRTALCVFNRKVESSRVEFEEKDTGLLSPFWNVGLRGATEAPSDTKERRSSPPKMKTSEYVDLLDQDMQKQEASPQVLLAGAAALTVAASVGIANALHLSPSDALPAFSNLVAHPQESLQAVIRDVEAMGPAGPIYFGLIYLIAEILAVPATPLTLSAGYLFGLVEGTSVVLLSATIAASVAFLIGKTFLRTWVEEILQDQPKFRKIDKAIGEEGFKLLLLVRLSPIFPFALSNYLYGASSIDFASYFWGTLLGFTPGTIAYVYTGMVGKALTLGEGSQPWYVYAGGFALLAVFLKTVTNVASEIVDAIDDEEEGGQPTL